MHTWHFPYGDLSAREEETLWLYAVGCRVELIATLLGVRPNSVRTYLRRAVRKLDAPGRVAAVIGFLALVWGGDFVPRWGDKSALGPTRRGGGCCLPPALAARCHDPRLPAPIAAFLRRLTAPADAKPAHRRRR